MNNNNSNKKNLDDRKDYKVGKLIMSELNKDPIQQFKSWLDEAVATKNIIEPTAMNLATYSQHADEYQQLLQTAFNQLAPKGVLVVYEDLTGNASAVAQLDDWMNALGEVKTHSAIATRTIEPGVEISQYSLAVEENLRQEKINRDNVLRVIQKA